MLGLQSIASLMTKPTMCSDSCLNRTAATLLSTDKEQYDAKAREWTQLYAMNK